MRSFPFWVNLGEAVSALLEVVSASVFDQLIEDGTTELPELVDGPCRSVLKSLLEHFVWSDACILVIGEIRHHRDVPGLNSSTRYPLRLTRHCRFKGRMPCCWNVGLSTVSPTIPNPEPQSKSASFFDRITDGHDPVANIC